MTYQRNYGLPPTGKLIQGPLKMYLLNAVEILIPKWAGGGTMQEVANGKNL